MTTTISSQQIAVNEFIANYKKLMNGSDKEIVAARQRLTQIQKIIDRKCKESMKQPNHHVVFDVR